MGSILVLEMTINKGVPFIFVKADYSAIEVLVHEANHRLNDIMRNQFPDIWRNLQIFIEKQTEFKTWVKRDVLPEGSFYGNLKDSR